MIPERFIMEDLKKLATYALLTVTFSILFYGYLNLIYDPVKDCAWTIQTLSPEKQSRLVENRKNFSAPPLKYVKRWCSANMEDWYSQFKNAKAVR
jgi:hypothetical protein